LSMRVVKMETDRWGTGHRYALHRTDERQANPHALGQQRLNQANRTKGRNTQGFSERNKVGLFTVPHPQSQHTHALGQQRLAAAGGAVEEDALGGGHAELLVLVRVLHCDVKGVRGGGGGSEWVGGGAGSLM
jgi:hypothetical protein